MGVQMRPFAALVLWTLTARSVSNMSHAGTYRPESGSHFPGPFPIFARGASLEMARYVVSAEGWVLSAASIFSIDVPFCFCPLCLRVNTEISLNSPQKRDCRASLHGALRRPGGNAQSSSASRGQ